MSCLRPSIWLVSVLDTGLRLRLALPRSQAASPILGHDRHMLDHGVILSVPINPSLELAIFYASNLTWERSPFICVLRQIGNIKIQRRQYVVIFKVPLQTFSHFKLIKGKILN